MTRERQYKAIVHKLNIGGHQDTTGEILCEKKMTDLLKANSFLQSEFFKGELLFSSVEQVTLIHVH